VLVLLSVSGAIAPVAVAQQQKGGAAAATGSPTSVDFILGSAKFSLVLSTSLVPLDFGTTGGTTCPQSVTTPGMIEGHQANQTREFTDSNGNKLQEWCIKDVIGAGFFIWRYIDKVTGKIYYVSDCAFDRGGNSWNIMRSAGGVFTGFTNNNTKPGTTQWNFWSYDVATNTLTLTKHNDGNPNKVLTFRPPPNNATLAKGIKDQGCDACETVNSQTSNPVAGITGVPEFGTSLIVVASIAFMGLAVLLRLRDSRSRHGIREAKQI
jgi:hypothetical protein